MEPKLQARQKTCVVLCLALLATALYGGCTQQSSQNAPTPPSRPTQPAALPSPSASPSALPDDTIIVIKGESIDIRPGHGYVAQPSSSPDESIYSCAGCKLENVEVTPAGGGRPNTCKVTNPQSTVTIDGGGSKKNIFVVETVSGVALRFNNKEYKECKPGEKFCNLTNKIKGVTIDKNKPTECSGCPANGKCDVTVRSIK